MTALLRKMELNDIQQVSLIESTAHIAPWSFEILRGCLLIGYDCRILEENNQILGYLIARHNFNVSHILNICIDLAFQRKGLGRILLRGFLDSLEKGVIQSVILEVRPSNQSALALYKSFGFYCDSIKSAYYKDEKGIEDALLLKKKLS